MARSIRIDQIYYISGGAGCTFAAGISNRESTLRGPFKFSMSSMLHVQRKWRKFIKCLLKWAHQNNLLDSRFSQAKRVSEAPAVCKLLTPQTYPTAPSIQQVWVSREGPKGLIFDTILQAKGPELPIIARICVEAILQHFGLDPRIWRLKGSRLDPPDASTWSS